MLASKKRCILSICVTMMMCGMLVGLSGCFGMVGSANKPDPINVSIRNATWEGGWAALVGQQLKDGGYRVENGYTIDIGNTAYRTTQKSMIIIQRKNDRLQSEAEKLQEILGFEIDYLDDFINPDAVVNSDSSFSSSVYVVLGARDAHKTDYKQYESEVEACNYPPIMGPDTHTILQIEPYVKQDS